MPSISPPDNCRAPQAVEPDGYRLTQEIIQRSVAAIWDDAKLEWDLASVYFSPEPGRCLCGHWPIVEHCVLLNRENGNRVVVGNVCVKKFLGLPSDKLFQGINRIALDQERAVNAATIDFATEKGWLTDWERTFYLDTFRKRKLSPKQIAKRRQINEQILDWVMLTAELPDN